MRRCKSEAHCDLMPSDLIAMSPHCDINSLRGEALPCLRTTHHLKSCLTVNECLLSIIQIFE